MADLRTARKYRFGVFEADEAVGELRRRGVRVKLNAQPFQMLCLLLDRPGELLTREEIAKELWPDGTFVDYEQGVNSAVNRIREALGDSAGNPRFVETLARRGYRFVAPVERIGELEVVVREVVVPLEALPAREPALEDAGLLSGFLATPEDLPKTPHQTVQTLYVLFQVMYLAFYVGALANLAEIEELFSALAHPVLILRLLVVSAGVLIPARAFLMCAVLFRAPGIRAKLLKIWPILLVADLLWSLAPFLLLHHFSVGLALSCTALLVYSPFAQRALVLMGAGGEPSAA